MIALLFYLFISFLVVNFVVLLFQIHFVEATPPPLVVILTPNRNYLIGLALNLVLLGVLLPGTYANQ